MNLATSVSFKVIPHRTPDGYTIGQPVELGQYAVSGTRSFNMGLGSWMFQLNTVDRDTDVRRIMEVNVREGDPVEYTLTDKEGSSWILHGFVSTVRKISSVDRKNRSRNVSYIMTGTGWGRVMVSPVLIGTAMSGDATPAVPRQNNAVEDLNGTPNIPGVINYQRWHEFTMALSGAMRNPYNLGKSMKDLVQILLDDVWKNPAGEAMVDRLSWKRFCKPAIVGIPYRIWHMASAGTSIAPDSILRTACAEAYTEVFYDYDDDNKPAIVVRPRYQAAYRSPQTIVKIPDEAVTYIDTTRSGGERYNYWRSSYAMQASKGIDFLIDTAKGQSPIIDRDSIERYGLRAVMPQNDLCPPLDGQNDMLSYHVGKINEFRSWYYSNPEFLTGTVLLAGCYPGRYRIGQYCEIPEPYWLQHWDATNNYDYIQEKSFTGYIVDVSEQWNVTSARAIEASTAITFIRGDSKFNIVPNVPDPIPWIQSQSNANNIPATVSSTPVNTNNTQASTDPNYVTEHIRWEQLKCKDGTQVPRGGRHESNAVLLCTEIEKAMAQLGNTNLTIISAYRTESYNTSVNGAKASQHLFANALDIQLAGIPAATLYASLNSMMDNGIIAQGGLGLYATFVHYDRRGSRQRWSQTNKKDD